MFSKMALVIEENRLKDRFNGTVAKAIGEVLEKETPEKYMEFIFNVLKQFNDIVKLMDEIIGYDRNDSEWKIYDEEMHERYINILLGQLNLLFIRFGKTNFLQKFSDTYWKQNQNFILQLWRKLPEGESVTSNEASFIKLFEDFFSETFTGRVDMRYMIITNILCLIQNIVMIIVGMMMVLLFCICHMIMRIKRVKVSIVRKRHALRK